MVFGAIAAALAPGILDGLVKIIDKIIPDPEAAAKAKLELMKEENKQILTEYQTQLSVILAEAQSPDPWTSRARPSFLYVVYILLLASIPMGVVYAISPGTAADLTKGFQSWLIAIPSEITELFKWVMLGYIGGRSWEKIKGAAR